jgi:hypothetical protein
VPAFHRHARAWPSEGRRASRAYVAGIHVFAARAQDVDGRHKAGHDEVEVAVDFNKTRIQLSPPS